MKLKQHVLFLVFGLNSGSIFSQTTVPLTLPVVTLMDIEPAGNFTLNFTAPTEAGQALTLPAANTTKWINYTSAIAPGGLTRRITASINMPIAGVNIRVQAAAASGAAGGTLGTSSGLVTLGTTAATIITGIGGAFTGNGVNNGHMLTISLSVSSYANLSARTNTPVIITYTITE